MKNFSPGKNVRNNETECQAITNAYFNIGPNSISNMKKINTFKKSNILDRKSSISKFKSVFDRHGNPFKYFTDITKHLNSNSNSLL
jgi:hypothetical protein